MNDPEDLNSLNYYMQDDDAPEFHEESWEEEDFERDMAQRSRDSQ